MNIGPGEMILLLVLALLLFGPRRLPEIGRAVGEGIASFKRAVNAMTAPEWESKPARQVSPAQARPAAPAEEAARAEPASEPSAPEGQGFVSRVQGQSAEP